MIDWLRDLTDMDKYPGQIAVLTWCGDVLGLGAARKAHRADVAGWMPTEPQVYNKWKAAREKQVCPTCGGSGKCTIETLGGVFAYTCPTCRGSRKAKQELTFSHEVYLKCRDTCSHPCGTEATTGKEAIKASKPTHKPLGRIWAGLEDIALINLPPEVQEKINHLAKKIQNEESLSKHQTMTDYERGWYHSYKLFLSMLTRGKND